jgi:hypothetical protein
MVPSWRGGCALFASAFWLFFTGTFSLAPPLTSSAISLTCSLVFMAQMTLLFVLYAPQSHADPRGPTHPHTHVTDRVPPK